jgi:hypothetical protein
LKDVSSTYVKTGIGNFIGNKGAVAISFKLKEKSIAIVNCHLAGIILKNFKFSIKYEKNCLKLILIKLKNFSWSQECKQ